MAQGVVDTFGPGNIEKGEKEYIGEVFGALKDGAKRLSKPENQTPEEALNFAENVMNTVKEGEERMN
jgi:hypothetical protein